LLVEGDVRVLIDTGGGVECLQWLREEPGVEMVISSHSHPDHTAGNWLFQSQ
jgi:glyoxylase-like metal-dependent hydrolase (beta-lactamase superfamily II)